MTPTLKFAVVREDPELESSLVTRTGARALLTVASGGCTALALLARHPGLAVTAFDLNPTQLAHVREKEQHARDRDLRALNVGDDDPRGVNQRGEFEGLFRVLRRFLDEFVIEPGEAERYFAGSGFSEEIAARWINHRYWPAAFDAAFAEGFLHAMFGPAATQHAEKGSYPGYFQRAFARGLRRDDGPDNPFLQHVLLGRYLAPPPYTPLPDAAHLTLVHGSLADVRELGRFDVISLSNIFDWSDDALVAAWAAHLAAHAKPGAHVLLRQLNNTRDLRRHFAPAFTFDDALGEALLAQDRSLFYNRIEVAVRA